MGAAQKIHILGPAASGKSTLARRLAAERGIEAVELDALYWDDENPDYGVRRPDAERDTRVAQVLARPAWVVEGVYYKWCGPLFEQAEQVILLDAPLWLRQARILRRYFRRTLGLEPKLKQGSLRSTLGLMAWDREWNQRHLGPLLEALQPHMAKLSRV